LDFVIPGILPADAISRKVTLLIPNFLISPLGLPVILHLLCNLTGEAFFRSLSKPSKSPAALRAALFWAYLATRRSLFLSRAFIDSLAITILLCFCLRKAFQRLSIKHKPLHLFLL